MPVAQWNALTLDQLNGLIGTLNMQIQNDNNQIGALGTSISWYENRINTVPGGLNDFLNTANTQYNSTLTEYIRVSSLVDTTQAAYAADNSTLSSFSTLEQQYISGLRAAEQSYSSLLSAAMATKPLIDSETSTLQSYLSTFYTLSTSCAWTNAAYQHNSTNYMNGITVVLPSLSSLIQVQNISLSSLTTALAVNPLNTDISTSIVQSSITLRQTISSYGAALSTTSSFQASTSRLLTGVNTCAVTQASLLSTIGDINANIQRYAAVSTAFVYGTAQYWSTVSYWSTLEQQALSSIDAYSADQRRLLASSFSVNQAIAGLKTQICGQLTQLDTNADTFYSKKLAELTNEVEEFRNASLEMNAFVGMYTAELMLCKLDLLDKIDLDNFYIDRAIQQGNTADQTRYTTERDNFLQATTSFQTHVNNLNVLDSKFADLNTIYLDEKLYKTTFIQKRSTLHAYERFALAHPLQVNTIQGPYFQTWDDMDSAITNANRKIQDRQTKMGEINSVLAPVKQAVESAPLNAHATGVDPFPAVYSYPYTYTAIPAQSRSATAVVTSEYAILPPIDFSAVAANYDLPC
jgi:hypothetical protein